MCSTVRSETQSENSSKAPKSISDLIGEWGPWQRRTVFFIFLCKIPAAWFMACVIFTAPLAKDDEFQCRQRIISDFSAENFSEWLNVEDQPSIQRDSCVVYQIHNDTFSELHQNDQDDFVLKSFDTEQCDAFQHNSPFYSLVTQFDLVCSRTILIAVTQFFHLCGVLTGGILATLLLNTYAISLVLNSNFIVINCDVCSVF